MCPTLRRLVLLGGAALHLFTAPPADQPLSEHVIAPRVVHQAPASRMAPPADLSLFEHAIAPLVVHYARDLEVTARLACTSKAMKGLCDEYMSLYDVFRNEESAPLHELPERLRRFIDRLPRCHYQSAMGLKQAIKIYDRLMKLVEDPSTQFNQDDFLQLMKELIAAMPIFRSVVFCTNVAPFGHNHARVQRYPVNLVTELFDYDLDLLPAQIPLSVREFIDGISTRFRDSILPNEVIEARERFPDEFRNVFPWQAAFAYYYVTNKGISKLDVATCSALIPYGIRFNWMDILYDPNCDAATFTKLYPYLWKPEPLFRSAMLLYRVLIDQCRLDLIPVLMQIPQFGQHHLIQACRELVKQDRKQALRFLCTHEMVGSMTGCQNRLLLRLSRTRRFRFLNVIHVLRCPRLRFPFLWHYVFCSGGIVKSLLVPIANVSLWLANIAAYCPEKVYRFYNDMTGSPAPSQ